MIRFALILPAIIISSSVFAQQVNVTLKIVNNKNDVISYASVTVTARQDTVHLQSRVADSSGLVKFSLPKGQYIVRITSTNYQPLEKGIAVSSTQHFFFFYAGAVSDIVKRSYSNIKGAVDKTGGR